MLRKRKKRLLTASERKGRNSPTQLKRKEPRKRKQCYANVTDVW